MKSFETIYSTFRVDQERPMPLEYIIKRQLAEEWVRFLVENEEGFMDITEEEIYEGYNPKIEFKTEITIIKPDRLRVLLEKERILDSILNDVGKNTVDKLVEEYLNCEDTEDPKGILSEEDEQ